MKENPAYGFCGKRQEKSASTTGFQLWSSQSIKHLTSITGVRPMPVSPVDNGSYMEKPIKRDTKSMNLMRIRIRNFSGDMSNDIHSPGPVIWEVSA